MTIATIIAILGTWFGFANPLLHLPPAALLLPAGLAAIGLQSKTGWQALRLGWLAGGLACSAALYWVAIPVHEFGPLPWALALPCPLLLGFYIGLYAGVFSWAMHVAGRRLPWFSQGLFGGVVWALLEGLRGWLFTGFPWLSLGSAFAPWPEAIQAAAFVGVYGLSLVAAACAVWLTRAVTEGSDTLKPLLAATLVLAGLAFWGMHQVDAPLAESGPPARVGIVQGNIDQSLKWEPRFQNATVRRYVRLSSREAVLHDPDLLVWPETALPFYFQEAGEFSQAVRRFADEEDTALLLGSPGYARGDAPGSYSLYNRAFLVGDQGEVRGYYDKERLVPFGEYVPLGEYLTFLSKLTEGVGDFEPGADTAPLQTGNLALGVLICYESIFPDLAQKRVEQGANVLVNISNDAWFGRSAGPWQHLHLSLLRAVEQGRYLVRATNTGISVFADPRGRVLVQSGMFTPATLHWQIRTMNQETVYHAIHGLLFPAWGVLALLLALRAALRPAPRTKRGIFF